MVFLCTGDRRLRAKNLEAMLGYNFFDTTHIPMIPLGSSRVENHSTWDKLEKLGRQPRVGRMARSP